jgi:hypothetical protein
MSTSRSQLQASATKNSADEDNFWNSRRGGTMKYLVYPAVLTVLGGTLKAAIDNHQSSHPVGVPPTTSVDSNVTARSTSPTSTAVPTDAVRPATTTASVAPPPPSSVSVTTQAPSDDPIRAAQSALDLLTLSDTTTANTLVGRWVPQLSAKKDGVVWAGVSYDLPTILAEHSKYRAKYQAILIRGDKFNFQLSSDWYVTVVPIAYDTSDGALAWCRQNAIGRKDCLAKLISNDRNIVKTIVVNR